jgi:hypothetical protein
MTRLFSSRREGSVATTKYLLRNATNLPTQTLLGNQSLPLPRDVYLFTLRADDGPKSAARLSQNSLVRPAPLYGENGRPVAKPERITQSGGGKVPMRVPVEYTYPEAFGHAEVTYCFEVGKLVQLATGGACRIEQVSIGTKFELQGGGIATVTKVKPLIPWPEQNPKPDGHGNVRRRVVGTVKHTGAIVIDVTVGSNTLTTTPEHLFWSASRKTWVAAKSLKRGELLNGADNQTFPVGAVSTPRKALVDLYNIEVEISHTYFVGNPPILVHNGYSCIRLPKLLAEGEIEADGLMLYGPNQVGASEAELHHIATIYDGQGNWASKFRELFNKAGYSLEDDINKIMVEGHVGPHDLFDDLYHRTVYDYLSTETQGLEGEAFRGAFREAMQVLRSRVVDVNDILNILITH